MTDLVNAGADEVKRANYGSKLEQWRAMQESGCPVEMSQHRDVSTSRRCQRRYVGSTNTEVNNLKRRDVSSRSAPHHLKYEWIRNQGIGRRTNEGTEFQSRSDTDFDEVPGICIVSIYFGY